MRTLGIARLGSALILSAGDRHLAITNFYIRRNQDCGKVDKSCRRRMRRPARYKRVLPGHERDHHSQWAGDRSRE